MLLITAYSGFNGYKRGFEGGALRHLQNLFWVLSQRKAL